MDATQSAVYGSSLFAATAVAREPSPRLTQDIDTEVCVVGGGLAGLTVAREIALRGWDVILVEAKRIAWNASGRNTGFVLPGFSQDPAKIVERAGLEQARALWELSEQGVEYVRATIAETKMEGVDPVNGWLNVSKIDRAGEIAARVDELRDTFGAEVEFWPADKVRSQLRSERYFQAANFPKAFHIHPLNYAFGLARAAEQAGVRIFEETPVLHIDPDGVRKRLATPDARLRAAHVILAGNVHLGALMHGIGGTLLPLTTYVAATAPLGEKLDEAMAYRGGISDTERADNHYRATSDNRLIWAGRITTSPRDPKHYARALRRDIARVFPQLGKVEIEYCWNGTFGMPLHRMPQVGEVSSGLWLASGFGGHGLNTTAIAGLLVAKGVVEGDKTWMTFNPFELIWAGGRLGRSFARLRYWTQRTKAIVAEHVSRRREAAERRAREDADAAAQTAAALNVPAPADAPRVPQSES